MMLWSWCICGILLITTPAFAAEHGDARNVLDIHPVWVLPFAGLLLSIALLPVLAPHFWESNLRKALAAFLFAAPVAAYLYYLESVGQPGLSALEHHVREYSSFILLLFALYTVSGGIVVQGSFRPTPFVNAAFLAVGAVLANFIGTTGASMVLIRPVLRINQVRRINAHIPIFFIFMVSNLGGLLTPLGDPPLFLGFLHGVSFFWTMQLWPQWLLANGLLLMVFLLWDTVAYSRQPVAPVVSPAEQVPFQVRGKINLLFLGGILAAVLLQSRAVSEPVTTFVRGFIDCPDLQLIYPHAEIAMAALALLSVLCTSRKLRRENAFSWGAIIEVAVLFAGIFVAMTPALHLLANNAGSFHLTQAWQFFWLSGALSSFLDNAPTYLTFGTIAMGGADFAPLMTRPGRLLEAISCGAVFFGAMTYVGNGPNFMVKAIAEESGYRTPSFFGYLAYSCGILAPIFFLVTFLFFRPST